MKKIQKKELFSDRYWTTILGSKATIIQNITIILQNIGKIWQSSNSDKEDWARRTTQDEWEKIGNQMSGSAEKYLG